MFFFICGVCAVFHYPHLRGMSTGCSEIGSVVAVWHQSAFTQWFPGGTEPRQSFHWLCDHNDKSIRYFLFFLLCQLDHTTAKVWWQWYGLLGHSVGWWIHLLREITAKRPRFFQCNFCPTFCPKRSKVTVFLFFGCISLHLILGA